MDTSDPATIKRFDTDKDGKLNDEEMKTFKVRAAEFAPLKHLVSPDDVAEAVCWFALGGRAITGQLLVIDAGTHLTVGSPL